MKEGIKRFTCRNCGFEFEFFTDWESVDEEEYKEISSCPCGEQMEATSNFCIKGYIEIVDPEEAELMMQQEDKQ